MKLNLIATVTVLTLASAGLSQAQSSGSAPASAMAELIYRAADETGKEIVFDERIEALTINSTAGDDADYASLLAVLRSAGYVAVEAEDQVLVLPENLGRTSSTRVVNEDDRRVSDHEYVTRVLQVPAASFTTPDGSEGYLSAAQLVPILRPMMSNGAQLAAPPMTNALIIVDRYDNVRRITQVIEDIADGLE